jgi:hypothetical protein
MRKILCTIAISLVAFSLSVLNANAATIGFSPSSSSVGVGDPVSVDIVVSGLGGEIVSAYDLDVLYDDSIVSATGVSLSSALGDEGLFEAFYASSLATSGVIDFAGLSLLSDASLLALQGGDSVVLATIEFSAIADGTTALSFNFDAFNDMKGAGAAVLDLSVNPGRINVGAAVVPEPTAALVFVVGLLVTGRTIRRRSA